MNIVRVLFTGDETLIEFESGLIEVKKQQNNDLKEILEELGIDY